MCFMPLQPTLSIARSDLNVGHGYLCHEVLVLTLLPEAVGNSVVSVATEHRQF